MITDDKHWNILISHVLQMKRRDWTNSSDFVTIIHIWYLYTSYALLLRINCIEVFHSRQNPGRRLALQIINKAMMRNEHLFLLQNELSILRRLQHRNILQLVDSAELPSTLYIVTELMSEAELEKASIIRHQPCMMPYILADNSTLRQRAAWGQEIIPIPAPHTMFCPHYRRYHGYTTEILPIAAVTAVKPR